MRIAVLGTGGIGGYFGGRLAAAGRDVTFVARGPHLTAIRDHGLVVTSVAGDFTVEPARVTDDAASIGEVDTVLLAVKTAAWPRCSRSCLAWSAPTQRSSRPRTASRPRGRSPPSSGASPCCPASPRSSPSSSHRATSHTRAAPRRSSSTSGRLCPGAPSARVTRLREAVTASGAVSPVPKTSGPSCGRRCSSSCPSAGSAQRSTPPSVSCGQAVEPRPAPGRDARGRAGGSRARRRPASVVAGTMAFVDDQPAGATTSLQRDLLEGRPSELDAWTGAVACASRASLVWTCRCTGSCSRCSRRATRVP